MVRSVVKKVTPKHGFAHFLHLGLVAIVPPLALLFIRLDIYPLAFAVVILGKWRMLAVRPRHWVAHIRTNAVDIIVSLSLVSFMIVSADSYVTQIIWMLIFEAWLLYLKPGTSPLLVSIQALASQVIGLTAIFLIDQKAASVVYVIIAALVSYFSARHFFTSFEEKHSIQFSWMWAFVPLNTAIFASSSFR